MARKKIEVTYWREMDLKTLHGFWSKTLVQARLKNSESDFRLAQKMRERLDFFYYGNTDLTPCIHKRPSLKMFKGRYKTQHLQRSKYGKSMISSEIKQQ